MKCPNCKECNDEDGCISCEDGYKIKDKKCELSCNSNCKTCELTDNNKCLSCSDNKFIDSQNKCIESCNNPGFYVKENQGIKYCLPCNSICATCSGGTSNSCTSCKVGYYLDYNTCKQCDSPCKTCQAGGPNCLTCIDYHYLSNNSCIPCDKSCKECSGTGINNCTICRELNYYIQTDVNNINQYCVQSCDQTLAYYIDKSNPKQAYCRSCLPICKTCNNRDACLTCNEKYFLNTKTNLCESCDETCEKCNGSSNKDCQICRKDLFKQLKTNLCVKDCEAQEFKNQKLECQECDSSCQKCDGPTSRDCLSCKANSYLFNKTCVSICPNGYFKNEDSLECEECSDIYNCNNCYQTCQLCTSGSIQSQKCQTCYSQTRILNSENKCVCKNSQDTRELFFHCSHQNTAVLDIYLSEIIPRLTIDFGSPLRDINTSPNQLCQQVFEDKTIDLLGHNCECQISGNFFNVSLTNSSTIMEKDKIHFKKGVLQFSDYPVQIDTFYMNQVYQKPTGNPQFEFQNNFIENTCNPIIISLSKIKNDAQRGFQNLTWSLEQITGQVEQEFIQKINDSMLASSQDRNTTLHLNPSIIPPNQNITIKFSYWLKVNKNGEQTFTIFFKKEKIIRISHLQSIYPPIYRYHDLNFFFQSYIEACEFGMSTYFIEPTNLKIISPQYTNIEQNILNKNESSFQLNIPPYTLPSNQEFKFSVILSLSSDNKTETIKNISIDVLMSDLFLQFQGGSNFMVSYQQEFSLASKYKDYEIQNQSDEGTAFAWECKSLSSSDNVCYNYKGDNIQINQGVSSITFQERTFQPYSILALTLKAQKEKRSATSTATCIFTEFNIPPLTVLQPQGQLNNKINLNQELYFTLQYSQTVSSDILSYAGALLYDNKIVGAIQFDYYQVKFRIWSYFKDIIPEIPIIQVRFSAYNPAYVMPSLATINLPVNYPPNNCVMSISPLQGEALQTIFTISYEKCTDDDPPLTYQFFYYNSNSDIQIELDSPWNITRRQIADQNLNFIMKTILPQGNLIIMSQAMDSQLGVSNKTIAIEVQGQHQTEEDYLEILNQAIQQSYQNQKSLNDQIVIMSIIGEDLSKNTQFLLSQKINDLKSWFIEELYQMSLKLPKFSLLSTFVNKVIAQLQQTLITSSENQKNKIYDQLDQILSNVQKSKETNDTTSLQQDNDMLLQNLIDSYKILNSTVKLGNEFKDYEKYKNISQRIGSMLSNNILPNEGSLLLDGNLSSLLCDTITQKNIHRYGLPDNQTESQNSTQILNIVSNTFNLNIYQNTQNFQDYVKQFENIIKNFQYSQNQLISTLINSSDSSLQGMSLIRYNFNNPKSNDKYNMTCLQNKDVNWSNDNCNIVKKIDNSYVCFCKEQRPTTIIESLEDMFFKNKNLKTILGEKGLQNISNFEDFYMYATFWTLTAFTLLQFALCFVGRSLDIKTRAKIRTQVLPEDQRNQDQNEQEQQNIQEQQEQNKQQQQEQLKIQQQQQEQIKNQQTLQFVIEEKIKIPSTSPFIQNIQEEQYILSNRNPNLLNKQLKSSAILFQLNPNQPNRRKRFSFLNKKNDIKSLNYIQDNILKGDQQLSTQEQEQIQTNVMSSQDKIKDSENSLKLGNKDVIFLNLSSFKSFAIFHSFLSIFYLYEEAISRQTKFSLFYIKSIHTMAICIIFYEYKQIVQLITVSLVNSLVIGFGSFIITFTYKKGLFGKIISLIIQMSLSLVYLYTILAVFSGWSQGESNQFMLSFTISFCTDLLFVDVLISNLMNFVSKRYYISNKQQYVYAKLFDLLSLKKTIDAIDN